MSTANFNSNQLGFPLYVRDNFYSKVCPECGSWSYADADECYFCGEDLENVVAVFDEYEINDVSHDLHNELRKASEDLLFFDLGVASGYYSGLQFDVNWKNIRGWGVAGDPNDLDNEDAHFYFDCCRSEMLKQYHRERRKIEKILKEMAEAYGFEEIVCVGVFSNGEAIYERAGTLRAAANAL